MNDRRKSRPRDAFSVPITPDPEGRKRPLQWDEWVVQVSDDDIVPEDFTQAIAVAFTKTCAQILAPVKGEIESSTGLSDGQSARASYQVLARHLGMKRDTFRLTYQGARWLTLPDVRAVLNTEALSLGKTFLDHLAELLSADELGVLRQDGISRRERLVADVRSILRQKEVLSMKHIADLERQARDSARLLSELQSQAQDWAGAFSTYWPHVTQAIEDPRPGWRSHVVRQLRACGYTVADVVREVLADTDGPVDTPRLAQLAYERAASVLGEHGLRPATIYRKTLTNAVSHLLRRGEIVSGPDGYQAVPRPAPKRTGEERI